MIVLRNENYEAGLDTKGACLVFFNKRNENQHSLPILRPSPVPIDDPIDAACFPCVPFFGRISDPLSYCDKSWPLSPNHPSVAPECPIHGDGWLKVWDIEEQSHSRVVMSLSCPGNIAHQFPYPWHATQTLTLNDNQLHTRLNLKNLHHSAAPMGLGLHPFFQRTPSTRLTMECGDIYTPPFMSPLEESKLEFGKSGKLPPFSVDHSFKRWNGKARITDETGVDITIISDAPFVHLYMPEGENYFCLEPISHLPGAYENDAIQDDLFLKAGASKTLSMTVTV